MDELSPEDSETLLNILQATSKHPNSKVTKLIRSVQEEASQKSIVLLLIELAEHPEYATDFGISLKYYLNLFEHLGIGREVILNEAGLLLLNSSKVYARRVDYVQELVEHQIITLTKSDLETAENKTKQQSKTVAEKPRRGRKRLLDVRDDPYEEKIIPKKFRKVVEEKRLTGVPPQNKSQVSKYRIIKQYLHQKVWMDSVISDLENEEENDSKRNYKFFTYQVEHRYNTLMTDINFQLFFLVKDYMEEEEERLLQEGVDISKADLFTWPPLSEEFIQKYLNLENKVLALNAESSRPFKRLRIDINMNDFYHIPKAKQDSESFSKKSTIQNVNLINNSILECNENSELLNILQQEHNKELMLPPEFGLDESMQHILDSSSKNFSFPSDQFASNETIENEVIEELENSGQINNCIKNIALEQVQKLNSTENSMLETSEETFTTNETINDCHQNEKNDSTYTDENQCSSNKDCEVANSTDNFNLYESLVQNDTGLGESINEKNMSFEMLNEHTTEDNAANITETFKVAEGCTATDTQKDTAYNIVKQITTEEDNDQIDLNKILVHLPHLNNKGVYFSELDKHDQLLLSPAVIATDVFPCITKKNITIIIDDEIKALLNIPDDEPETFQLPIEHRPATPQISLNIFKINEKFLRRRVLFKLGHDMDLFLRARSLKRGCKTDTVEPRQYKSIKLFTLNNTNQTENQKATTPISDCDSDLGSFYMSDDEHYEDFLGFTEEEQKCNGTHRLSRDSGVSVDVPFTSIMYSLDTSDEDFQNAAERLLLQQQSEKETNNENIHQYCKETSEVEQNNRREELPKNINEHSSKDTDETDNGSLMSVINLTKATNEKESQDNAMDTIEEQTNNKCIWLTRAEIEPNIDANKNNINALPDLDLKIQKWHEHLRPILAKSRERHHFDVFQIGTEIMDKLQKPSADTISPKIVTFEDVMSDKSKSSVSRYFLSSLLLANQNNIKITVNNKSAEVPSEWEDIHFELLSIKRHNVTIEDNIGMASCLRQKTSNHVEKTQSSPTNTAGTTNSAMKRVKNAAFKNNVSNVNLNIVCPLKQIGKLPHASDDFDSGIFSAEDCTS